MSDDGNYFDNDSVLSGVPTFHKTKSHTAMSECGGALRSKLKFDQVELDYGAIVKPGEDDQDNISFKTGFSFLDEGRKSMFSQLSSATNIGSSRAIHAFLNLWKVFIGIGILTGPSAMSHCGVILGILGVTFAGLLSLYSINIQAQTRHKLEQAQNVYAAEESGNQNNYVEGEREEAEFRRHEIDNSLISSDDSVQIYINNYSELGRAAFGNSGYVFVSLCLFIQQMGSVTAYFWFINKYLPIPIALTIILPFWLFLNIKKISYLSLFSLFAICCALTLVVYHSIEHMHVIPKDDVKMFDIMSFPLSFGVSIFIFEGNWASLQIETSMKEPKNFKSVSVIGILTVIILNWVVSTLAYFSYVGEIKDVVLFNLPSTFTSKAVRFAYSFGLMFSIPIQIAPMVDTMYRSDLLDDYIKIFRVNPRIKYYSAVVIILLTWVLWALIIPCLQIFINLSGSFVGILTLAILPILFYNKAFKNEISKSRLITHYVIIIGMSIAGAISIVYSVNHMISG